MRSKTTDMPIFWPRWRNGRSSSKTNRPTDAMIATLDMPARGWSDAARATRLARVTKWACLKGATSTGNTPVRTCWFSRTRLRLRCVDSDDTVLFGSVDRLKVVFVDGVFDAEASDDLALDGIKIERLADATSDLHWARDVYGVLENNGQNPVPRPLAALNTAFAADGVLIHVTGKPSKPVRSSIAGHLRQPMRCCTTASSWTKGQN